MPRADAARCTRLALFLLLAATAAVADDAAPAPTPTPTLLFVAELCRHGDRTPLHEFPSDALPASKWPEGVGQLTAIGQRAQYDLGTRLRSELVTSGFLPSVFSPSDVHVRSSGIDRALMSALSQLAGLYPPGSATRDDVRVRFGHDPLGEHEAGLPHAFQPVPLHSDLIASDALLLPDHNCPRQQVLQRTSETRTRLREAAADSRAALQAMARAAGVADVAGFGLRDAVAVHNTWTCASAHGVPLPDGASTALMEFGRNVTRLLNLVDNNGREMHRLRAGLLLNSVREYMALVAQRWRRTLPESEQARVRKFVLFSAHGSTLAAALAALRVFDGWTPAYNSTVVWRLHAGADNALTVRVEYNGAALRLPGCTDEDCAVDEYVKATREVTVNGEQERVAECATGWRRLATGVGGLFVHQSDTEADDELGVAPGRAANAHSSGLLFLGVATVVALAAAVAAATRFVLRRKDYMRAPQDDVDTECGMDETTLNRRILL